MALRQLKRYIPPDTNFLLSVMDHCLRSRHYVNVVIAGITTPFDMTVPNDLDRFHLVMATIDRLPQTGGKGIYLKQQLRDKLVEHKQYLDKHGQDLPEIRNWR